MLNETILKYTYQILSAPWVHARVSRIQLFQLVILIENTTLHIKFMHWFKWTVDFFKGNKSIKGREYYSESSMKDGVKVKWNENAGIDWSSQMFFLPYVE